MSMNGKIQTNIWIGIIFATGWKGKDDLSGKMFLPFLALKQITKELKEIWQLVNMYQIIGFHMCYFIYFLVFCGFFSFLGPHLLHMEVPRLGV